MDPQGKLGNKWPEVKPEKPGEYMVLVYDGSYRWHKAAYEPQTISGWYPVDDEFYSDLVTHWRPNLPRQNA